MAKKEVKKFKPTKSFFSNEANIWFILGAEYTNEDIAIEIINNLVAKSLLVEVTE